MQWLNKIVDEVLSRHPEGEILVESGVSPSGTYHVGTLREVLTCDAIMLELRRRGRQAKHIHYVDDLDPLRKIPVNVPSDFEKYFGKPYEDIPSPDGSNKSYADFFLEDFLQAAKKLNMDMVVIRSHEKYRNDFMMPAIEQILTHVDKVRKVIADVSGRKLEEGWAPIQVMEDGYLKSRRFKSIDTESKTITYLDADDFQQTVSYKKGNVKLNWRVDWPARWALLGIHVEPFGRDHGTKGGSYDTGAAVIKKVFGAEPPVPLTFNFIIRTGETKKMSKSAGDVISISEMLEVLPPEVVRYFTLRYPADKQLFFDEVGGVTKLIDDFAELLAKDDKTKGDEQLIEISTNGIESTVSSIPFSHLIASYQAALKDPEKTLQIIARSEYGSTVEKQRDVILRELKYIDRWLEKWAPEDVKFELLEKLPEGLPDDERNFLNRLGEKIAHAPQDADGEWFHKAIYELKDSVELEPKQLFEAIYKATIGKTSGPRAGWFLSILPREWLVKRLKLEA